MENSIGSPNKEFRRGPFSPIEMSIYCQLTADLSDLIDDEETFRLFTLVLLFSIVDNSAQFVDVLIVQNCTCQKKIGPM